MIEKEVDHGCCKFITRVLIILVAGIFIAVLLMTAVYFIPTSRMEENVRRSIDIFYKEGVYPQQVAGYKSFQLDNETDAIMLLGAIYDGKELSPLKQAMRVARVNIKDENSGAATLVRTIWENEEADGESTYTRYWHGYMLWLKPLLFFLDYADIRVLNFAVQIVLLLVLVQKLVEQGMKKYLLPLGMALIAVNPVATAMSLQFSCIYFLILIGMILILKYNQKWDKGHCYPYVFLILGIVTNFFDFLTYPMAALCMPLILLLLLKSDGLRQRMWITIEYCFCFVVGYGGMWLGKWLVSSIILNENILLNAFSQITVHSGNAVVNGEHLSRWDVVWKNLCVLARWPYILVYGIVGGVYLQRRFVRKEN